MGNSGSGECSHSGDGHGLGCEQVEYSRGSREGRERGKGKGHESDLGEEVGPASVELHSPAGIDEETANIK